MSKFFTFLASVFFLVGWQCKAGNEVKAVGKKTLVVYFSCSGNTKNTAKYIAEVTGGALYEIIPKVAYTDKDLDWRNNNSRANKEHRDRAAWPALSGALPDFRGYDVVYLGYPIWWGEAPRIMLTFLESSTAGLKGKTIVPFCTSHSSPLGGSDKKLHSYVPDGKWLPGKRFRLTPSKNEVAEWVKGL